MLKKLKPYIITIAAAFLAGALGSVATSGGMPAYEELTKPALNPPDYIFPIAWSILYLLMGIGAGLVWSTEDEKKGSALAVYGIQLAFNALWSIWFFGQQMYLLAFIWLVILFILVLIMSVKFYRIKPLAGLMQIPYLLWLIFAGYLNFAIWQLN